MDQGVVAVASINSFWGIQVIFSFQLDAGNILYNIHQLIDADRLALSEIDRFKNIGVHNQPNSFQAVVDKHK